MTAEERIAKLESKVERLDALVSTMISDLRNLSIHTDERTEFSDELSGVFYDWIEKAREI